VIDQSLLGSTVAKCMDSIEESPPEDGEDGEMIAVGLVVVIRTEHASYTRTYCSETTYYRQRGLFEIALETVKSD
jgi:hypothetical protein